MGKVDANFRLYVQYEWSILSAMVDNMTNQLIQQLFPEKDGYTRALASYSLTK